MNLIYNLITIDSYSAADTESQTKNNVHIHTHKYTHTHTITASERCLANSICNTVVKPTTMNTSRVVNVPPMYTCSVKITMGMTTLAKTIIVKMDEAMERLSNVCNVLYCNIINMHS